MDNNFSILNTKECADTLHRSEGAVRNLVLRRKIPFRKPGGRLVFIREEIRQWIYNSEGVRPEDVRK